MKKLMQTVSWRTVRALRGLLIPGLALLLALVPAAVVNIATPQPVTAAIVQRGSPTTGTTLDTSLTIDKPADVVAGDVMIVNIAQVGNDSIAPASPGWTLVSGKKLGGVAVKRYGSVLYRVADGAEGASFTFALGAGTDAAVGSLVAFSGVDTSGITPFDADLGAILVGTGAVVQATSITIATPGAAVIMFGMAAGSPPTWSGWTTASAGALTELYDSQVTGTYSASVGAAWTVKADAGPTGLGSATLLSPETNGGILVALKPAMPATLTVDEATGVYGGTASLTATLSPAVPGKTISFTLNGAAAGTAVTDSTGVANLPAASLSGINAGAYPAGVGASFAGDAGYCPANGTANLTVAPRRITVTADNTGKVYGDPDPALTYHISSGSLALGDAFTGSVAREAGESVGTYAIGRGTLNLGSNYDLTFVEGAFSITPRSIEVAADDSGKVYGDADPVLTYHISSGSVVANDAFTGELAREPGEKVGTYAIRRGTLALNGNYCLTFIDGVFTIVPADAAGTSGPTITGISPQSGKPGETLDVTISGSNFGGTTAVRFGPGVTVNSFAVETPSRIVANISIDPGAEEVENNVVVITPLGEAQSPAAFSISLSEERPGTQGLWLLLTVLLVAAAVALVLFGWLKRQQRKLAPALAPVLAPTRPPGEAGGGAEPAQAPSAPGLEQAVPSDAGAGVAASQLSGGATGSAAAAAAPALGEIAEVPEAEEAPMAVSAAPPSEYGPASSEEQSARDAVAAPEQPAGSAGDASPAGEAPSAAAREPDAEVEKAPDVPDAVAAAAVTPRPRRRTVKKTPASKRPRTSAKRRRKATG
ncbi:MAG: MBG domain-containing protein [Dehalococcoidia bacterium]|nr:MBG domain-containing protein [Dehalococcoidia bacterium]